MSVSLENFSIISHLFIDLSMCLSLSYKITMKVVVMVVPNALIWYGSDKGPSPA